MLHRLLCTFTLLASLVAPLNAQPKPDAAIFISSLPQSIDLYPVYTMIGFYKLNTFLVSSKTFPKDNIQTNAMERFVAKPSELINTGSVPPSQANIDLLTKHLGKMVLLARDPRDALVSWIAYTDIQRNHPITLGLIYPAPPQEYFTWSYEKKADWQIEHYYTYAMTWLNQWAAFIASNPKLNVLVTHFEEMATQPLDYFKEVVAFYGTDPALFTTANVLPMSREQYRQNAEDIGTWKKQLTPAQQKRVTQMLDDSTARLFHWSK